MHPLEFFQELPPSILYNDEMSLMSLLFQVLWFELSLSLEGAGPYGEVGPPCPLG